MNKVVAASMQVDALRRHIPRHQHTQLRRAQLELLNKGHLLRVRHAAMHNSNRLRPNTQSLRQLLLQPLQRRHTLGKHHRTRIRTVLHPNTLQVVHQLQELPRLLPHRLLIELQEFLQAGVLGTDFLHVGEGVLGGHAGGVVRMLRGLLCGLLGWRRAGEGGAGSGKRGGRSAGGGRLGVQELTGQIPAPGQNRLLKRGRGRQKRLRQRPREQAIYRRGWLRGIRVQPLGGQHLRNGLLCGGRGSANDLRLLPLGPHVAHLLFHLRGVTVAADNKVLHALRIVVVGRRHRRHIQQAQQPPKRLLLTVVRSGRGQNKRLRVRGQNLCQLIILSAGVGDIVAFVNNHRIPALLPQGLTVARLL